MISTLTKTLAINLADVAGQGDMFVLVSVDGHPAYRTNYVADVSAGGTLLQLGTVSAAEAHTVTVQFTDANQNAFPDAVRDFFVSALLVNGGQAGTATLHTAGTVTFEVPASHEAPPVLLGGTGPDTVTLSVSADALPAPQFYVTVDGVAVGGVQTASAAHAAGESQAFTLNAAVGSGHHVIGVRAFGAAAQPGGALHIDTLTINGVQQAQDVTVAGGAYQLAIDGRSGPVRQAIIGSGAQVLTLSVSEDAYQGDAQYIVTVDGQAVSQSAITATGWHSAGEAQTLTVRGDFGDGPHKVGVTFLNDLYGGTSALDRNLYLNSVKFDGVETLTMGTVPIWQNGTYTVEGSFAPPAAPPPAPAPVLPPMPTVPVAKSPTTLSPVTANPVAPSPIATSPVTTSPLTTSPITPAPLPAPLPASGVTGPVGLVAVGAPDYPAGSRVLTVGAGKQYSTIAAAIGASTDGTVILVDAGTYTNDFAVVSSRVTLLAVGGRVIMNATVDTPNQKGLLVAETDLKVVGFTFTGAHISDDLGHNAAGIRVDNGHITLINDEFTGNQNGILTNAGAGISITIDHSLFNGNGAADNSGSGNTHNIYVGDVKSFTMTNSISKNTHVGHEVKSRAETNTITNNLIISGVGAGTGSYDIDLPNGGKSVVANNTIIKGPHAENHTLVHFGGEGIPYAGSSLTFTGNLLQNTADGATGILNQTSLTAHVSGNTLDGLDYAAFVKGPATIATTVSANGTAYSDSVLTGILPGSTAIFAEADTAAHHVALNGGMIQAVQGGAGLLTVDVSSGHVVVIGGSGGSVITEVTDTTGGNSYQTMAGSTNTLNLNGGGTIDSEGLDTITVGYGNSSGQLNGTAHVTEAGTGNITWGVNGTATVATGPGSTFASLGATGTLTLTGTGAFHRVDSNGGTLNLDIVQGGQHVSGSASGGSFTTQVYDHKVRLTTAGGSQGVALTMGVGDVDVISKGADVIRAGAGTTVVQVAGNATVYAGSGNLSFYGFGSSGADLYGAGGTYELGGDTGNITYHGGDQASTLNDDLGRGTILGGAGRLTVNGSARDTIVGGSGGLTLNMTGGGANTITTAAGSTNALNLTGGNAVRSYGQDIVHQAASNADLAIYGNSTVSVDGGNSTILLAGHDALTVAGGHDVVTVAQGASVSLALHGNQYVYGLGGTVALSFTNDAGFVSSASSAGAVEIGTDTAGGISMQTGISGATIAAGAGQFALDSRGADQVTLGSGAATLVLRAAGAVVHAGSGATAITGGYADGAFTVIGGAGAISADASYMRMTFIGGSGDAVLGGQSLDVFGGSGAIKAGGVHSFTGGTGAADLVLTAGARVTLGSGTTHVTAAPYGDADTFVLSPASVGHAVIDGFRVGTDHLVLSGGTHVTTQSVGGGGAHLMFGNGADVMLTGVQDVRGLFA